MVRRLLTLLLAVPLLLPPGICVCDFVPEHSDCAACPIVAPVRHACACCAHEDEEVPPITPARITSGHCAPEKGDTHLPACPARATVAQWKCRTSPPEMTVLLAPVAVAVLDAELPALPLAAHRAPVLAAKLPIYLTTLSLRI